MSANVAGKELLAVLGDVKASVQDKLGIVDFPIPQFILIGKQSVGKSRLIEALAGEQFNFTSGTLGSRRPTVLEFRNVPRIGEFALVGAQQDDGTMILILFLTLTLPLTPTSPSLSLALSVSRSPSLHL